LAEIFGQPVWCVSIEPAAGPEEDQSRLLREVQLRRLIGTGDEPSEPLSFEDAFNGSLEEDPSEESRRLTDGVPVIPDVDGIWSYSGTVGVPSNMTDEQVADVFRSLTFQDFVCQGLHEDQCQVVAVRVVGTHIHFDILVYNGTFSTTTTTEMPWGLPWWAWFLICCLTCLLCALCCLPLAGAGAAAGSAKGNAKEPLRGTYQSLEYEQGEAEDGNEMADEVGSTISASEVA